MSDLFDLSVFLDCDLETAIGRVAARHLACGIEATPHEARCRAAAKNPATPPPTPPAAPPRRPAPPARPQPPTTDPAFHSAIAAWHMSGPDDARGRNPLRVVGAATPGIRLEGQ